MRLIILLLSFCLAVPALAETVQLGDRYYDIYLPADPDGAPVILALHGGGGDPDQFATASISSWEKRGEISARSAARQTSVL